MSLVLTPVVPVTLNVPNGTPWALNVAAYGATGNGVTDDLEAIIAAISAAQPGNSVFFPAGTYRISNSIDLSAKIGIRLIGPAGNPNGAMLTGAVIVPNGQFPANTPLIKVVPAALTDVSMFFQDIVLNANSVAQDCLLTDSASSIRCSRVVFVASLRYGLAWKDTHAGASNSEAVGCYFNNCATASIYSETIFNQVSRCLSDDGQYGILTSGVNASNLSVDQSHFENASVTAIKLGGFGGNRITNTFMQPAGSIGVDVGINAGASIIAANVITGKNTGAVGVRTDGGGTVINGNYIDGSLIGVDVTANGALTAVTGNRIVGNSGSPTDGITTAAPNTVSGGNAITGFTNAKTTSGSGTFITGS